MVPIAFAADDDQPVRGNSAMLFEFSGLGFLWAAEYRGGLGYKMYMGEKMALRTAVRFLNTSSSIPWTNLNTPGDDGKDSETGFGLEVALEFHGGKGKIDPYFGFGGGFNMVTTKATGPVAAGGTAAELKNDINGNAATTFSGFALLGVEYFVTPIFSLAAEYHLGYSGGFKPDQEFTSGGTTVTTIGSSFSNIGISSVGVLTLAIYL